MKILECSPSRLALTMGLKWFNSARCDFDKSTGRARIERVILFWPCKPIDIPLTDIADVRVAKVSFNTENGSGEKEYPEMRLRSGKVFALPSASLYGKSVRLAVEQIRNFLGFTSAAIPKG